MKKNRVFHVISNTHWDREWRFPFQRNRQMLVEMIDKTLEILESESDFKTFHLDSQTVVLEDYLEIKPQNRELIRKFVKNERLLIGPWYILPEEFQVGGESLIRNLLLGHKICAEFGKVMKVGYSPFSWGQISQLPQIYKEFGIDVVMFYRGVNSLDSKKAEFIWQGADGTEVLTSRFSTMPRYNFYFYIYRPVIHNEKIQDVEHKWTRDDVPFHFADKKLVDEDYSILNPANKYYSENLKPSLEAIIKDQADDFTTPHIMWMDGHDSSGPNKSIVRIVKEANEILKDDQIVHSNLEEYSKLLKKCINKNDLPIVKGERRSSQYDSRSGNMYGFTTSARMYLKQINFDVERWLQFYAEPFNSIAALMGFDTDDNYLDIAWKLLLQNSAHDSIGGCSLDTVHEDMITRYKQSKEISQAVFDRACKHIMKNIDLKNEKGEIFLTVINPIAIFRDEIVEAYIDIPQEMDKGELLIKDSQNNIIDMQIVESQKLEPVLEQMTNRPKYFSMNRYHCYLNLKNIPSMGYKVFNIFLKKEKYISTNQNLGRAENNIFVLENENLKIKINSNGTFNIIDKSSKHKFKNLGYFYDEGEAGHAWVHKSVKPVFDTLSSKPIIKIVENGPLFCKCRIHHELKLPANLDNRKEKIQNIKFPICLDIILKKQSKRVEFEIRLNNKVESHRMRIMFPLNLSAQSSFAEGQFDVIERPITRVDTSDWVEQPMYDYPMHYFVALGNEKQGAAILVDGLKEYEVLDDDKNTLAITLFRAFNYVIQPSSVQDYLHQKGSQCFGEQKYRMAFYPFSGTWEQGNVYSESLKYNYDIRLIQAGKAEGKLHTELSFIKIQPENLIFSCLKFPEKNEKNILVLRLYNPTLETIKGQIKLFKNIKKAIRISLEEIELDEIPISNNDTINLKVLSKKIITVKIIFID